VAERAAKTVWILALLACVAALAALTLWVVAPGTPASGPVPVAWDKETCAHCHMHIGEPGFAAQLQTRDGAVLDFDDPGCLFEWMARHTPPVSALYFHHASADRWLTAADVAFIRKSPSPMGFGLAAVDPGTPGSISLEDARAEVLAGKKEARGDR
jgi:NosL